MKKFIALVVLLCAVLISSSASAVIFVENYITSTKLLTIGDIMEQLNEKRREEAYRKEEESRKNEIYHLAFTVTLTIGLIVTFFAYKYSQNREFIREYSFSLWLSRFVDRKNFWLFIFCVVSLVPSIFYVPYNLVGLQNPDIVGKQAHATIFETPKDFSPPRTRIDYQAIVFRELLILLGCCAGCTASTIMKKK